MSAEPSPDSPLSALVLFDAYLAEASRVNPLYRTDLRAGGDPAHVLPGRFLGQSPVLGLFTYRPKSYEELTLGERATLLHDPKFHAFLIASRSQADDGDEPLSEPSESAAILPLPQKFSISPAEILRPRPVFVILRTQ